MLHAVQRQVRTLALRSADSLRVGPFLLRIDPAWPSPAVNYAVPDDGAAPTRAEVAALVAAFRERGRLPRLEYLPGCAPLVRPALLAAGFRVTACRPVLACAPDGLRRPPRPAGVRLAAPAADAQLRAAARVQHEAFGQSGEVDAASVDWLSRAAEDGRAVCAYAGPAESVVGAAVHTPMAEGTAELVGVAVAEPFRRRGIAAALSAHLTAAVFARGAGVAWVEAEDDRVARIYARVGYQALGEKATLALD